MSCSTWRATSIAFVFIAAANGYVSLAAAERTLPSSVDVPAWIDSVKMTLTIPSEEEIAALRKLANHKLHAVHAALDQVPDGAWIRRVCELDQLAAQLASESPDPVVLENAYFCLRDHYGYEIQAPIAELRRVVDQLRGWITLKAAGLNEDELTKHIDVVAARINHHDARLSGDEAAQLRYSYAWLAQWRRADAPLASVIDAMSQPNQIMTLKADYMKGLAARRIVHPVTIYEQQDEATISGQGDIHVVPALELIPNDERGEVLIRVNGQGTIPLVAASRPATVYANSHISFSGEQVVYLTPTGVETAQPHIIADSNTSLCSVELSMRSRIARRILSRIVRRVASRKLSESDVEAAQRAQQQIRTEVVDNSLAFATQLNDMMDRFVFNTMDTRDIQPNVRVHSSTSELTWSAEYIARWQLGALTAPPTPSEPVGVLLQFQESAFNNASAAIAGVRLDEPAFQEVLYGMFRLQPPDDSWQMGGRIPAVLHLAERSPLEVRFEEGRITATLRLQGFEFGGESLRGNYRITATYQPHLSDAGVTMERIGETVIEPANGNESELLKSATARFFIPRAIATPRIKPRSAGSLAITHLRLEDGWLSFGLSPVTTSDSQ